MNNSSKQKVESSSIKYNLDSYLKYMKTYLFDWQIDLLEAKRRMAEFDKMMTKVQDVTDDYDTFRKQAKQMGTSLAPRIKFNWQIWIDDNRRIRFDPYIGILYESSVRRLEICLLFCIININFRGRRQINE